MFSTCRWAAAIMATTICWHGLDNAVDAGLVVAVAAGNSGPGQGTLSHRAALARSSRSEGARTSILSASLSRIPPAVEQQSAPQLVTSIRCLQHPLICSTLIRTAAPASIPALPVNWRLLTEVRASSARKSRMPKRQVQLLFHYQQRCWRPHCNGSDGRLRR